MSTLYCSNDDCSSQGIYLPECPHCEETFCAECLLEHHKDLRQEEEDELERLANEVTELESICNDKLGILEERHKQQRKELEERHQAERDELIEKVEEAQKKFKDLNAKIQRQLNEIEPHGGRIDAIKKQLNDIEDYIDDEMNVDYSDDDD